MPTDDATNALHARHLRLIAQRFSGRNIIIDSPAPFARGANNLLYRFRLNNRDVVAKVGVNPHFRNLHLEKAVLDRLGTVGPQAIDFFVDGKDDTQIIVLEHIGGVHRPQLDNDGLVKMGAAIAAYHCATGTIPAIPHETEKSFLDNRLCPVLPAEAVRPWGGRYYRLRDSVIARVASLPDRGNRRVLVHGDLIPLNIINQPDGQLRIIDWEGVRYDAPEADIATLYKAFKLDDDALAHLLAGYAAPFDRAMFNLRLLMHYLQVIAWRMSVQLPQEKGNRFNDAARELEEELCKAEAMVAPSNGTIVR